jgi:hypothetical protein
MFLALRLWLQIRDSLTFVPSLSWYNDHFDQKGMKKVETMDRSLTVRIQDEVAVNKERRLNWPMLQKQRSVFSIVF